MELALNELFTTISIDGEILPSIKKSENLKNIGHKKAHSYGGNNHVSGFLKNKHEMLLLTFSEIDRKIEVMFSLNLLEHRN